jgi:ADP-heptose:LPS heptosyltransferase
MPRRRRWRPVKGTANRVYEPWERLLVGALDLPGRLTLGAWRALRGRPLIDLASVREVLVLRLDRIGDVFMSLPALADLRAALPRARIRLAVGQWSADAAKTAPVDEVLVWNAPWVGRAAEGADTLKALYAKASALDGIDLGLDLQGDVRASVLLWATGARYKVGYANTGGGYLLTHVVPLDETVSWVEQNRRAVSLATGRPVGTARPDVLTADERDFARRLFENLTLDARRPVIAIHPSGGRLVKQWDIARWIELAGRLQQERGATILVTGSAADRALAGALLKAVPHRGYDMTGRLSLREMLAVLERVDLFLSPDTGPMHMAAAVDAPAVAVFGPSDAVRYFSGASPRQVFVRHELWCSPCNLIRKPPPECSGPSMPECLQLVTVDAVHAAAVSILSQHGAKASGALTVDGSGR